MPTKTNPPPCALLHSPTSKGHYSLGMQTSGIQRVKEMGRCYCHSPRAMEHLHPIFTYTKSVQLQEAMDVAT